MRFEGCFAILLKEVTFVAFWYCSVITWWNLKDFCLIDPDREYMLCLCRKPVPLVLDQEYVNLKNQIIKAERRVLKELGFCVHVKHPHKVGLVWHLQPTKPYFS